MESLIPDSKLKGLRLLLFFIREKNILFYERIDTRKGSEVWRSKHHWKLIGKEIIVKTMHEARSKDELYRKIYHEPEGNIGVLRVKLMHSLYFLHIWKEIIKWLRQIIRQDIVSLLRIRLRIIQKTRIRISVNGAWATIADALEQLGVFRQRNAVCNN